MLTVTDPNKIIWGDIPLLDMARGNCLDTDLTLKIYKKLMEEIDEKPLYVYNTLIRKTLPILAKAEFEGLDVDLVLLEETGKELDVKIKEVNDQCQEIYHETFEGDILLSSDKQVYEYFFLTEEGLCLLPTAYTDTNAPSVAKDPLVVILDQIDEELAGRREEE